ncbi:MAG: FAD-dependent oxidoreductase [Lentimicrobiaceae bacterium]|jgi:monoamine oxidase|nr:FAD-dependent oxidoreductase [Lentimicrobiaceae bacterium]MBT3453612.1 FAD-dependent oxidoreductase [Lentimicrobiaceae bacterium]MBT3817778.1 FAD-dependent oxidoreductase [Lentimicrobiaceae bacterium]MBT4191041.1 FAD-dependent oxidoreductase [Lentimicrobiaceae bacterium]MBT4468616.1 FAD-dependent oxidoreductase [Lentimicrobiaceae bacterium]
MKRRQFIKNTMLAMPSITLMMSALACNDDDIINTDKTVLVIGAGVSGLAAAKYLSSRNVTVNVIEAQSKVGGRLKTNRSLDIAFDEGASWIHGPDGNPITELISPSGVNTFPTNDNNVEVYDINGSVYDENVLDTSENAYNNILNSLAGSIDKSFEEVFYDNYPQYKNNRLWSYMLSAFLEFDTGGDISELSSLDYYDDEEFSGDDIIVTNGYDRIADYLAKGLNIELNKKVTGIDYSASKVLVSTTDQEFSADYVIVTVPLGVLKNNVVNFTPSLSGNIQNSINNLKMGSVNKFLCVWDTPFWDTNLQYIGYTPETMGKFNYFLNLNKFSESNALMTFAFGDYSKTTENMADNEVIDEIMNHLKSIYGSGIPEPTKFLRTKWVSNEYTFGSYSFATNGTRTSDFSVFEESMNNKLFFAGEHTSKDYRGTVHGAYNSGFRAAEQITNLL